MNDASKREIEEKIHELTVELQKYGTSAGAVSAWDTRGRGQKETPRGDKGQKNPPGQEAETQIEENSGTDLDKARTIADKADKVLDSAYAERRASEDELRNANITYEKASIRGQKAQSAWNKAHAEWVNAHDKLDQLEENN